MNDLRGGWQADFNSLRRAEVIQPGTIQTGDLSEATVVPENKLAAIKFASYKVTSPEVTSAAEPSSTPRPQRLREPSAAIATYNIQEQIEDEGEQDPKSFEAMASYDRELWIEGIKKEIEDLTKGIKL